MLPKSVEGAKQANAHLSLPIEPSVPSMSLANFSEAIIKNVVDHINNNNLLSHKQYEVQSARSTADVPTTITRRNPEARDIKYISRIILHRDLKRPAKMYRCSIFEVMDSLKKVFSRIKSFLRCRPLNIVVKV